MPVYVLFTKADLIAGFSEFFDDLDREKRAQVWGTTFEPTSGEEGRAASFAEELSALVERLNTRLFDRIQAERNPERRSRIAMFPGQILSLQQPLMNFLQAAFGGSRSEPAPLLRGVYITSGTQEGTPIDRLTGVLARAFGVDQARAQSLQPQHGRSYFLERLLKNVIFGEAMLVSAPLGAARRRVAVRVAGFAVAALLVVGAAALLWHIRTTGQREIAAAKAALASYEQVAQPLPLDPVADDDLLRLGPLLDQARTLSRGATAGAEGAEILADAGVVAEGEARRVCGCRLPPRAGMGSAAAVGMAPGNAVARQPGPPGFSLRGDPCLSHVGQCGPARRLACA